MSCHLWYVRPLTDQSLVHLGLGVPSQCQVPKWSSTEMAAINYGLNIHHRQLQKRHSNETQRKLQTIPHTIIEAAKERILATTLPPKSKLSQVLEVYRVTSTAVPLSFPSVSNSSAHPIAIASTICTCYTLSSSCTWHTTHKQLYIAT